MRMNNFAMQAIFHSTDIRNLIHRILLCSRSSSHASLLPADPVQVGREGASALKLQQKEAGGERATQRR
jgi:hypothetical protein